MKRLRKTVNFIERIMNILFGVCGFSASIFVILITGFLVVSGTPAIGKIGIWNFLFGTEWASTASVPSFGILPFILTSVYGSRRRFVVS